jgi:membrane protein
VLKKRFGRVRGFLQEGLWNSEGRELGRIRLVLLRHLQVVAMVARGFVADGCVMRASALTYTTLLSIVPLLALMFSLVKGLGGQEILEPLLLGHLARGSEEIISAILSYIENTNFRRLGTAGLILLLATVLALLSNIEQSFNHIWGVKETRSLMRRFADYFSVVLLSPLLVLAAFSISTSLRSQALVQSLLETAVVGEALLILFQLVPYVALWTALTFMYLFMPNTRVRFGPALVGGIFGGTLWQLAQWLYVNFQIGVSKYNAIYGTMAALPIFMVWLYVSWVIVLLGLELSYAIQNLAILREELGEKPVNFASRERLALAILLLVTESFIGKNRSWTHARLCAELRLPPRLARRLLTDLERLGFLAALHEEGEEATVYHPARAPETITLQEVRAALRLDGTTYPEEFRIPAVPVVDDVEAWLEGAAAQALDGLTLRDLARSGSAAAQGEVEGAPG